VSAVHRTDRFLVATDQGQFAAPTLVIATGGCSIPKMGATRFAYDLAQRFELPVVGPQPWLGPLKLGDADLKLCRALTGVSLEVNVRCAKTSFREALLFTHRGLSGPAILQISSYWRPGKAIEIDLVPDVDNPLELLKDRRRTRPKAGLGTVLAEVVPVRLAQTIAADSDGDLTMANLPDRNLAAAAQRLKRWVVRPVESEGWDKAEVTVGGIDTAALSSRTMEAREARGLYAIGEAVDVTGWLGGYNFQWAWSSGWCAGQAV
jgi:predicted Rossmann fold flavoprotein